MKAEINNENKAKFFAQYWGQDILCSDMYGDGGTIYSATMKDSSITNECLELKPLSDISDEDLRILQLKKGDYSDYDLWMYQEADYLRSRGYLLGWGGLTEDEIIEAGWAKYKE